MARTSVKFRRPYKLETTLDWWGCWSLWHGVKHVLRKLGQLPCPKAPYYSTIRGALLHVQLLCLNVSAPPSAPTITSPTNINSDQLTVTWTSVPMATSYNVSINGSTPISLPANANTYTFTGLTNNTVYTVSVVAINCAGNSYAAMTARTSK